MATTDQSTLNATHIMPSLTVNDLHASLRFFEALGFEIEDKWEQNGSLLGAMLKAGTAHGSVSARTTGRRGKTAPKASACASTLRRPTTLTRWRREPNLLA